MPDTVRLPFNEVSPRTSNLCVGTELLIPTLPPALMRSLSATDTPDPVAEV